MPNDDSVSMPAQEPAESSAKRPSRGWYGVAFVVLLIGLAAFTASINVTRARIAHSRAGLQQVVAPGVATLSFEQPGRYLIYYVKQGELDGQVFDTFEPFSSLPKMRVTLTGQEGNALTLARAEVLEAKSEVYDHGRANSEFAFDITVPGSYTLSTEHANPGLDTELLLAVGPSVVSGAMAEWKGVYGGASVLAFALVISAVIALVVWALRSGKVTRRED